jgi:asparagine synthase (glutamine-hydrolysing)
MSGFCALVRRDGAPVDAELLEELTTALSIRGPDARGTWIGGPAGLGHTLFATTDEAKPEREPLSLDGAVWIAADARIDGRLELTTALKARGRQLDEPLLDAELILHAYHAWGDDCVAHLIGDFAFVIWDRRQQRLLAARDHFGVKPFFYAHLGQQFVCSNTLACIRRHPAVTDRLNESAVADFLLFESNQDPASTTFADIHRLPAGTRLICSMASVTLERYWTLPSDLGVRYRDQRDYVPQFQLLLEQAITDRLRTAKVGVAMSGGLDSTAIAAIARSRLPTAGSVRAHAVVYDQLIPDEERHFASIAASHIGIPINFIAGDGYQLYEAQKQGLSTLADPLHDPGVAAYLDSARLAATHSRVALTGWDGDALLNESPKPYFRSLIREGRYRLAAVEIARYALSERRLLPRGLWRSTRGKGEQAAVPAWISKDFAKRFDLAERAHRYHSPSEAPHPIRPYAYRVLQSLARDPMFFETYDAAFTGSLVEYRHPLLDLRLVEFCLSLPPRPWCVRKEVLRQATLGLLPEEVRLRPKTALAGWPMHELLQHAESDWVGSFEPNVNLAPYVASPIIAETTDMSDPLHTWPALRPLSLNFWLRDL